MAGAWSFRAFRRLGATRFPVRVQDASTAAGALSAQLIGEEAHRRRELLLCPAEAAGARSAQLIGEEARRRREPLLRPADATVACSPWPWLLAKKPFMTASPHNLHYLVTRTIHSSKAGEDFNVDWTRAVKKYIKKQTRSTDKFLYSMGYRPSRRFRPFLLLLALGVTSQAASEVKGWVVAVSQGTTKMLALLPHDVDLMEDLQKFVEGAQEGVVADGFGWGYEFF